MFIMFSDKKDVDLLNECGFWIKVSSRLCVEFKKNRVNETRITLTIKK